jgi:hypothetical protein
MFAKKTLLLIINKYRVIQPINNQFYNNKSISLQAKAGKMKRD